MISGFKAQMYLFPFQIGNVGQWCEMGFRFETEVGVVKVMFFRFKLEIG